MDRSLLSPFLEALKEGHSLAIEGQNASSKAFLVAEAVKELKRPCLLIAQPLHSHNLLGALEYFTKGSILELPAWETLPSENIPPSPDVVGERLASLMRIGKSSILVSSYSKPHSASW